MRQCKDIVARETIKGDHHTPENRKIFPRSTNVTNFVTNQLSKGSLQERRTCYTIFVICIESSSQGRRNCDENRVYCNKLSIQFL
jgi:hypothetical protein